MFWQERSFLLANRKVHFALMVKLCSMKLYTITPFKVIKCTNTPSYLLDKCFFERMKTKIIFPFHSSDFQETDEHFVSRCFKLPPAIWLNLRFLVLSIRRWSMKILRPNTLFPRASFLLDTFFFEWLKTKIIFPFHSGDFQETDGYFMSRRGFKLPLAMWLNLIFLVSSIKRWSMKTFTLFKTLFYCFDNGDSCFIEIAKQTNSSGNIQKIDTGSPEIVDYREIHTEEFKP